MPEHRQREVYSVVTAAAVLAAACLLAAVLRGSGASGHNLVASLVIAPLIVLCRLFPLHVAHKRQMSMDSAPIFAAALLLPPWLAALCVGGAVGFAEAGGYFGLPGSKRVLPAQVVFNGCQGLLSALAGAVVFSLAGRYGALASTDASSAGAALVAAVAVFAVNDLLLLCVVVAQVGRGIIRDWFFDRGDIPYDVALYASGFVLAVAASSSLLFLPLLTFPVFVFHRAMRDRVLLRIQTREAVEALADVVDARDPSTFEHSKRVAIHCRGICLQLRLSPDLADEIVSAARVHDVGKVGVRDAILLKPGRLSSDEYDEMKKHPDIGARITSRFPDFQRGTAYVRHHHERWDGAGYPLGMRGTQIPLGARCIAVADTFDAMTSTRIYRAAQSEEAARAEMERVAGSQLDPELVDAFFAYKGWGPPRAGVQARHRAA